MIQKWFEPSTIKIDVTAGVNVTKNDQKTRDWWTAGFWVIFCDIYTCCDINFDGRGLKSFLDHNSVNS